MSENQTNKCILLEIWKPIIGYEHRYHISNFGRVRSLEKIRSSGINSGIHKEFIMKNRKSSSGYYSIGLAKDGKTKNFNIHRLVAEHFIKNIENKSQVNHKDGNKLNCNINNLEWVTPSENGKHAYSIGLSKMIPRFGKENPVSRKVVQIFNDGSEKIWDCALDAIRNNNTLSSGSITRCCQGKYKHHKNFKWRYYED